MTLRMLDSVNVHNLTPGADAYAAYIDGRFANYAEVKARFPGAHILSIAVFPAHDADCCDVEQGDLDPTQVPPWVKRQLGRGAPRPAIYASASVIPGILAHLHAANIARTQVRIWSAHYQADAGKHICGPQSCAFPGVPACDGTQWTDTAPGAGGAFIDESLLGDGFFTPPAGPYRHTLRRGERLAQVAAARNTTALHLRDVTRTALTETDIDQGKIYYTSKP